MSNERASWDSDLGGRCFRDKSDKDYKRYLESHDKENLRHHNLMEGSEQEIGFALALSWICFGSVPSGKALDVACGWGMNTFCLHKEFGFEAVGFDINEDAVRIARESFAGVEYLVADGTDFPMANQDERKYDLIYIRAFHPLDRIDDFDYQIEIIKDYLDLLNDNGVVVIADARQGGQMRWPGLDLKRVRRYFENTNIVSAGPFLILSVQTPWFDPKEERLGEVDLVGYRRPTGLDASAMDRVLPFVQGAVLRGERS